MRAADSLIWDQASEAPIELRRGVTGRKGWVPWTAGCTGVYSGVSRGVPEVSQRGVPKKSRGVPERLRTVLKWVPERLRTVLKWVPEKSRGAPRRVPERSRGAPRRVPRRLYTLLYTTQGTQEAICPGIYPSRYPR